MELTNDFNTFLSDIRLTQSQKDDLIKGHTTLRDRLNSYDDLSGVILSDFLQGSYRRSTAIKPKGDTRADVDVIVVTKLSEDEYTPNEAMDLFVPFLDNYYKGKWRRQGRSFGIELSYVDLDVVITSAPSESEEGILKSSAVITEEAIEEAQDWRLNSKWLALSDRHNFSTESVLASLQEANDAAEWKSEPLRIPDSNVGVWQSTHPLEQIRWTYEKNRNTNRHFVNVVKALKWWRLENYEEPKHPKGFPLERIVGEFCPDGIESVAEGIVLTMENIVNKTGTQKLVLADYGVSDHDVLAKLSDEDFAAFYDQVCNGAELARKAFDSTDRKESGNLWRELLGTKFPVPPTSSKGFTAPVEAAVPGSGRFA